ncbi:threonine/serine exporter family protein [Nicoliella lavandulae]|uniref:Threonine/serine exporter family protein n=1 Tax=Nicoliella lavandulae TaxID=3082954 RepID=A0ABU8SJQ5_9LACO
MPKPRTKKDVLVVETCLLAGKIMIENGSEMSRVTDTIYRIAENAQAYQARAYVTLTGIMMSPSSKIGAQVAVIEKRTFNLEKVSLVNDYSRQFAAHKITLQEFYNRLVLIERHVKDFPFWLQTIAAGLISGTMEVVFRNNLPDFWISCLVGMLGWIAYFIITKYIAVQFISEFMAAFVVGSAAILAIRFHIATSVDDLIIGGIMPLVPGVPITNAVRDALSGNLVSGPARGIEALMIACALGFGVALALTIF